MIDIAKDVDLFQDQTIRITRKAQDFSDITSKESEFSKTFQGPASRKNFDVIDNYGLVNANSSYNPHKGIECIWTIEGTSRFQGRLEVRKVIYEGGEPKSIEFVFYGKQRTLANIIGTDRFSEIDWSDYDHDLTYDNVRGSWFGTLLSGDLLYPLVDSSRNYFYGPSTLNIEGNIANENHPILLTDIKPAILFSAFLTSIFSNYDLTLNIDTDLSAYIDGLFILPNRLSGSDENPDTIDDSTSQVDDGTTPEITTTDTAEVIEFSSITSDPNSQWTSTTYTAQIDGQHEISGFVTASLNGPNTPFNSGFYEVQILVNGIVLDFDFTTQRDEDANVLFAIIPTSVIDLVTGDVVTVQFFRKQVSILIGQDCRVTDAQVKLRQPVNQLGGNVNLVNQMPDDKVVEWLAKFFKSWNLQIIDNPLNPTEYTLKTVNEWYDEGEVKDWSKVADIKNLVYSKRKVYREINYKYKESESSTSQTFLNVTGGRAFGELRIRPDVEFGEAKLEIENPCNIIPPSVLLKVDADGEVTDQGVNISLHKSLAEDGSPVAEPWLLFYYNEFRLTLGDDYYLQDGFSGASPTGQLTNIYPRISSIQDTISTSDSNTLSFSLESALLGDIAESTAYKIHWQDVIINQYDPLSRRLENVEVYLTTEQFTNYVLNDEIYLEGNYWRIAEIKHDATGGGKTQVTLNTSRTNNSPRAFTISSGGKISFTGTPDALDLTSIGSISLGADYYVGAPLIKITPNLNSYLLAKSNISVQIIKEINEIGGRFRSWSEDES